MRKSTWIITFILVFCTLLLSVIWVYFQKSLERLELDGTAGQNSYERRYVLIPDPENTTLWQDIRDSAAAAAEEAGVCLESLESDQDYLYTTADYLRIAIASKADGILLRPDGSEEIRTLIDEAAEDGIPVITLLDDDSDSRRTSFVGVNSYQMADTCADLALSFAQADSAEIMLLVDSGSRSAIQSLVTTRLAKQISEQTPAGTQISLTVQTLESASDFDSEEGIRDLFVHSGALPDVMVCLNEVLTECVCQALVDYNEVGSTSVIGYYYSDQILSALEKDVIPVTLAPDAEEIGSCAVNALEEYYSLGRASSYYNVELLQITREEAAGYLESENTQEAEPAT